METIVDNFRAAGADGINEDAVFKFASGDDIAIDNDADELSAYVADITSGALALTDQTVTVNAALGVSVSDARKIANDTSGTVTATITAGTHVSDLTTLYNTGSGNETNAWSITLHSDDATRATAAELNTINSATSAEVNAAAITGIAASSMSDVGTLLTSAVATDPREFTTGSFDNLTAVNINSATIDVTDLNTAITNAGSAVTAPTVPVFTLSDTDALINDGTEAEFEALTDVSGAGATKNINLGADGTTYALTISGTIADISNANAFTAATNGTVTGTIVNTTRVSDLTTLTDEKANAAYAITINTNDAANEVTAANLNRINSATTGTINANVVTELKASDLTDLTTFHSNRADFSNTGNIATINLTDNGGAGTSVDYSTLETIVDNFRAAGADGINEDAVFKFANADAITIDDADEVTAYVADITSGALALTNQTVTVDSTVNLGVTDARKIANDTSGTVTATIASGTRVSDLTTLYNPGGGNETNAWTITLHTNDATAATAAELNTIDSATSVDVTSAAITGLAASDLDDLTTLNGNAGNFSTLANITAVTLTENGGAGNTNVDYSTLETIIDAYQARNGAVAFTPDSGDTIVIDDADEVTAYVSDITNGRLVLDNQAVTVDSSVNLSITDARKIANDTSGTVTATIASSRVSDLTTLYNTGDGNETNAWTITVNSDDAANEVTAAELNTLNAASSVAVNVNEITELKASDLTDLTTLHTNRAGFSNTSNIATINLTDNGGAGTSVDYSTLETIVDNFRAAGADGINEDAVFKFANADAITIDDSDEVTAYVADITSGALALTNQTVTVDSSVDLGVTDARKIANDTSGTVTATIASSRVSDLTTLYNPGGGNETNAWTITVNSDDAANQVTAAELNTLNSATSVAVNLNAVTELKASDLTDLTTLHTNRAGFSNTSNIATINITDNGGAGTSVDYSDLETIVDNFEQPEQMVSMRMQYLNLPVEMILLSIMMLMNFLPM